MTKKSVHLFSGYKKGAFLNPTDVLFINPLVPEFKIPTEPINAGDKMVAPRQESMLVHITLYSPFLLSKCLQ